MKELGNSKLKYARSYGLYVMTRPVKYFSYWVKRFAVSDKNYT